MGFKNIFPRLEDKRGFLNVFLQDYKPNMDFKKFFSWIISQTWIPKMFLNGILEPIDVV